MSDTYCDIIKVEKLIPIDGSRTLQYLYYGGLTYAISKDIKVGDVVAVFVPDGRLSEEFAQINNLVTNIDQATGKNTGGFFGKNRKVRTIKLMGGKVNSAGFVATQEHFDYTGIKLGGYVGQSLNEIAGYKICNKFVNKQHEHQTDQPKKEREKVKTVGLIEHPDTKQFYRFAETLEPGDLITITLKLNGTSVRVANTYVKDKNRLGVRVKKPAAVHHIGKRGRDAWRKNNYIVREQYKHKTGTRRVVIANTTGNSFYGNHEMYLEVGKRLEGLLHPGESIFGEIVGWKNEEKALFNRGGMKFLYGCPPGTRDFYVYNIRWTLPDGSSIDLPWNQIKRRCIELGVKYVPELKKHHHKWYEIHPDFGGSEKHLLYTGPVNLEDDVYDFTLPILYDGELEKLERTVYGLVDGPDPIDPSHIREGVVIRVDKVNGGVQFLKAKSQAFYDLEDKSKNDGEVDQEEMQEVL